MPLAKVGVSKKLTVTAMGWPEKDLTELVKKSPKVSEICNVLAFIDGMKAQPGKFDSSRPDVRFLGRFEGTNLETGEVVRAGEAFFPKAVESWLEGQVKGALEDAAEEAKEKGKEGRKSLAIGFTITVARDPDPRSKTGYKYGCTVLVDTTAADPFLELRKALPAPKAKK